MAKRDATQKSPGGRVRRLAADARRRSGRALARYARRFGVAVVLVLGGLLCGLGYALVAPTAYTATAYVLVVDNGGGQSGPAAVSFAQAYGRLAPLPETLAWSALPLPRVAPGETRAHIQASTSPDTPLIRLSGSAATPGDAAGFANASADALVRYGTAHRGDTGVRVALMSLAARPSAPSSPNLPLDASVGTATGVLLAGLSAAVASGRRGRGSHDASRFRPATA
ncbi:hypothetical protein, partial [Actinomadura roseirufa]|uniref:hypothetical protein n=1 Tax=Actinomadura roseirufa TaxID=2094049 RepID=UPI001040F33F